MDRLRDRVILITGSTGIAAATAVRCVAEEASVFVVSRSADHASALADRLTAEGAAVGWAAADLADDVAADGAVDAAVTRFGRIDGLFAVAGGSGRRYGDGPIHELTPAGWDRTLEINLRSQAMTCRAVVRHMLSQPLNDSGTRGSILLMGSVTATDPSPGMFGTHAYAAAKGATISLMTTMAAAYASDRIRVNVVAPSLTDTPMAIRASGDARIRAYAARKQPLAGEMMDPDEVAHAALYFLSDESRAVTGQVLKVDGGWSVISTSEEARPVTFVRTVLGDIDPSELGVTYAHEHVVIDGGRPVLMEPDFALGDVNAMAQEVAAAADLGLRSIVDAMPCDCGRNAAKLAELSRRTGVNIVAPTGLHHERFYGPAHWSHRIGVDDLAELFVRDITDGIDELDYSGPIVRRTPHRAGVVKVAGSLGGPSERDRMVFEAAAIAHVRTGVPILTHCEAGTGALEQIALLAEFGVDPSHVILSHVDKVVDRDYHRAILATGASAEYDQSFRSSDVPNPTAALIGWMVEDGFGDRIVLGMDAARRGYLRVYGGSPGLIWLLDGFTAALEAAGVDAATRRRLFVDNPARAFAFAEVDL